MIKADGPGHMAGWGLRLAARGLAVIWAGGWTLFGILAGLGEGGDATTVAGHLAVPGLLFVAAAAIAWRWELAGGALLVLGGLLTHAVFWFATTAEGFVVLSLPGLMAGGLFLAAWYAGHAVPAGPAAPPRGRLAPRH